jgi:predicted transcriptional regulator
MTTQECIDMLEEIVVKIDTLSGSLSLDDPFKSALDEIRDILSDKSLELIGKVFNENTSTYSDAVDAVNKINKNIQTTITDIKKVAETFATLQKFVKAIDNILKLIV